jgi:mRNA interferase MazF
MPLWEIGGEIGVRFQLFAHAASNETNPFAVKFTTPKGEVCYVLAHQPKSFAWKSRGARLHPWKQVPPPVFEAACEELNGIISIGV